MRFLRCTFSLLLAVFPLFSRTAAQNGATVVDDLGRTVTLRGIPHRIISLAPSITEMLFSLHAGDDVVGVTDFCNYPPEATRKPRVGGITNPSMEAIVGLKPDLLLLSMEGNMRDDFDKLTGLGVPVFVTNPRTLSGIHKSLTDLGRLTGREAAAADLVRTMQEGEDSLTSRATVRKTVMLVVSLQPLIVVGARTFLAELLQRAGGVNIASSSPSTYPTLSREAVVASDPEVIIVMSDVPGNTGNLLTLFPEWNRLRAFSTHQVYRIDSDIVSRPGPRAVDGLAALYRIIQERHP